jgi:hypothetical protein
MTLFSQNEICVDRTGAFRLSAIFDTPSTCYLFFDCAVLFWKTTKVRTWHGTGRGIVGRYNEAHWLLSTPTAIVENHSPINYETGLVIGLPVKPYHVDWFIHRSLILIDVKLCLFNMLLPFVYTMSLFIGLVVFPKEWAQIKNCVSVKVME